MGKETMQSQANDEKIEALKHKIGFKTAFMATLGFYVAQTLMTFLGLVFIVVVFTITVKLLK